MQTCHTNCLQLSRKMPTRHAHTLVCLAHRPPHSEHRRIGSSHLHRLRVVPASKDGLLEHKRCSHICYRGDQRARVDNVVWCEQHRCLSSVWPLVSLVGTCVCRHVRSTRRAGGPELHQWHDGNTHAERDWARGLRQYTGCGHLCQGV